MRKYVARRLFLFIPTIIGISIAIFALMRVIPGDIAIIILSGPDGELAYTQEDLDEFRETYGLNAPIYTQYFNWMWDFARGDLGDSIVHGRPIMGELQRQFPVTLQFALLAGIFVVVLSVPIGIVAAVKQDGFADYILRGLAIMGLATPSFFVALLIILFLSTQFRWTPPLPFVDFWDDPSRNFQQLIFPAIALGLSSSGLIMRLTRAQLLEVLREDYVRTARAKGLAERAVIFRHAVRNSLLPVVTIAGTQIGFLFSGTVLIETIFNLPGIGRGLIQAVNGRDLPAIQIYIMYFGMIALVANLLVDVTYAWLDPRIKYS